MSTQELDAVLALFKDGGPNMQVPAAQARRDFDAMAAHAAVPRDARFERLSLGGVPALRTIAPGAATNRVLFHLHGGAYVVGSAEGTRPLWTSLARAAGATGISVDYALAPEAPYPAGIESALAAYRGLLAEGVAARSIAVAGDSAGGGIAIGMLAAARAAGLPMPAAAIVLSPWVDLECLGGSMTSKAGEDPLIKRDGLLHMARFYVGGRIEMAGTASPLNADLAGLPPLLIQVGSAEVLLDDAVRLAAKAGAVGVATRLEIWPRMIHVWHNFAEQLSEGREAIDTAGAFAKEQFSRAG